MSHFLADRRLWTLYFLPGLKRDLGPAWWALVEIALAGLIAGIVGIIRSLVHTGTRSGPVADPEVRNPNSLRARNAMAGLLALVGLARLFGYIVTPQPNLPGSFVYDFRFTLFAFASGAIALPIALGRWRVGLGSPAGVRGGDGCVAIRGRNLVRIEHSPLVSRRRTRDERADRHHRVGFPRCGPLWPSVVVPLRVVAVHPAGRRCHRGFISTADLLHLPLGKTESVPGSGEMGEQRPSCTNRCPGRNPRL